MLWNFKLPSETLKFDGTQDPKAWFSDHLSTVKMHSGNKNTLCNAFSCS